MYHKLVEYLYGHYGQRKAVEIKSEINNFSWWACKYNILIALVVLLPMLIDISFDLKKRQKHIVKWISYSVIIILIFFVNAFVVQAFVDYQPV